MSEDGGVHWRHLPDALRPTDRAADTSGCWSGCVAAGANGTPQALYTGVRLKSAPYDGPATRRYAPHEPMIESVMVASCIDAENGANGAMGSGADASQAQAAVKADGAPELNRWSKGTVVIPDPPYSGVPQAQQHRLADKLMLPVRHISAGEQRCREVLPLMCCP